MEKGGETGTTAEACAHSLVSMILFERNREFKKTIHVVAWCIFNARRCRLELTAVGD
jgi:hypothetical protein